MHLSICVKCGVIADCQGEVVHEGEPRGVCLEGRHAWEFLLPENAQLEPRAWLSLRRYAGEKCANRQHDCGGINIADTPAAMRETCRKLLEACDECERSGERQIFVLCEAVALHVDRGNGRRATNDP